MKTTTATTTNTNTAQVSALALPAPGQSAIQSARQLLAYLAPLFPNVSSMTKSEAGAAAWITSWASQIEAEGIGPQRLAGALTLLGKLDPDVPLSWPRFAQLVSQHRFAHLHLPEDEHDRERKKREFKAKFPGARFAEDIVNVKP